MVSRLSIILLSSTLLAAPAFAQTSPSTGGASSSGAAASGHFVTEQPTGQWRASKLIGLNVYSNNNERIGDINEILVDNHGMAKAVVIGVGGFLGIGEKNVAVAFDQLQWVNEDVRGGSASNVSSSHSGSAAGSSASSGLNAGATTAGTGTSAGGATTAGTTAGGAGVAGTAPAGGPAAGTAPARSPEQTAAYNGYPNHAMLRMSKADLQNAPTFRYYADRNDNRGNAGGANTGAGNTGAPNAPASRQ